MVSASTNLRVWCRTTLCRHESLKRFSARRAGQGLPTVREKRRTHAIRSHAHTRHLICSGRPSRAEAPKSYTVAGDASPLQLPSPRDSLVRVAMRHAPHTPRIMQHAPGAPSADGLPGAWCRTAPHRLNANRRTRTRCSARAFRLGFARAWGVSLRTAAPRSPQRARMVGGGEGRWCGSRQEGFRR